MKAYAMTDRGRKRQINQDAVYYSVRPVGNIPNLFVVADGMGGHQAGDFASRFTIDHLVSLIEQAEGNNPITILNDSIRQTNRLLVEKASEDEALYGMGTTLVAACVLGDVLCVANVGDIITEADGQEIASLEDLYGVLRRHSGGDQITVTLYSPGTASEQGGERQVTITLLADNGETQN